MRPIYVRKTGVTSSASFTTDWIVIDQYVAPGNVAVSIKLTQETTTAVVGTITLEFTNDDIFNKTVLDAGLAAQPYTATPFNASGQWAITGLGTTIGNKAVVEGMFAYAPRAVRASITLTAGQVSFEAQVIQLGIAST